MVFPGETLLRFVAQLEILVPDRVVPFCVMLKFTRALLFPTLKVQFRVAVVSVTEGMVTAKVFPLAGKVVVAVCTEESTFVGLNVLFVARILKSYLVFDAKELIVQLTLVPGAVGDKVVWHVAAEKLGAVPLGAALKRERT